MAAAWNPFLGPATAANYAVARPDYHPRALAVAVAVLGLQPPVTLAVDVGCGTGMSSRAIAATARTVLAVDVSRPMLASATPHPAVLHLQAAAERLPVRDGAADLVVAAAALHWFDQQAALREIARVLRPGGGLAVYTDYFSGGLAGADDATAWLADTYRPRFPAPARGPFLAPEQVAAAGLEVVGEQHWEHDVPMTADALTRYLMSQSNATTAIDDGRVTAGELHDWLGAHLRARMPEAGAVAHFTGRARCCRRPAPDA